MIRALIPAAFALLLAGPATAAPDIAAGREVAQGFSTEAKGSACVSCHGVDGAGDRSGAFPRLSGQASWYLYKQLMDYANGEREDPVMSPIARELSEAEIENVAAYYAAQEVPQPEPPSFDDMTLQRGGAISAVGLPELGVPSCESCHGRAAEGIPPVYPLLAGQYAPYLELQMRRYRDGERTNDPLGVMQDVAAEMDDEAIAAVSAYLEAKGAEDEAPRRETP